MFRTFEWITEEGWLFLPKKEESNKQTQEIDEIVIVEIQLTIIYWAYLLNKYFQPNQFILQLKKQ
jgi:hypothetical protein